MSSRNNRPPACDPRRCSSTMHEARPPTPSVNVNQPRQSQSSPSQPADTRKVSLYLAVYKQAFGKLYHWALAARFGHGPNSAWHIFEVIQDVDSNGGGGCRYVPVHHRADPTHAVNCLRPLRKLAVIPMSRWECVVGTVQRARVPGRGAAWNCQDYVLDIWEGLFHAQVITYAKWSESKEVIMEIYGPVAGWDAESWASGAADGQSGGGGKASKGFKSNKFVYESDTETRHR